MSAMMVSTGTEASVYSVSMVKSGTASQSHACARTTSYGTATSAKDNKTALAAEYGIRTTTCASVPMARPGTALAALSGRLAAAANSGTTSQISATARLLSTGTDVLAFTAQMVKSGMLPREHVFVRLALSGTVSSAR